MEEEWLLRQVACNSKPWIHRFNYGKRCATLLRSLIRCRAVDLVSVYLSILLLLKVMQSLARLVQPVERLKAFPAEQVLSLLLVSIILLSCWCLGARPRYG